MASHLIDMDDWDNDLDSDIEFDCELDNRPGTPNELIEAASEANKELLPSKSKDRYQKVYDNFEEWKKSKKATSNSERVFIAYFTELATKSSPSTLWARYSMLKATMKIYADNVDISTYPSLCAFLKKKSQGYVPKKAKIFTEAEIKSFIDTAPDIAWLDLKVTSLL